MDIGNLISGSSAFSKSSLNIWKFMVHILLKPSVENFEHCFSSMWDECNCAVVWTFFGIAFPWDWNENWPFPVLWPLLSFPNCWHIEHSTLTASSLRIFHSFFSSTVKGFSILNEAEVDVFMEFSSFFYDPTDVGNLSSGSSACSKSSLNIWKTRIVFYSNFITNV